MEAGIQDTIVILASLVAAVLVAQTILILVFVLAFRNWASRTETLVQKMSREIEPVLKASRELLVDGRDKIASLTSNLNEVTLLAKSQMERVDGFVKNTTERAQMQIVRLDQLVGETMERVDQTTHAIQHGVLGPIREATAVVAGVRTALAFMAKRNRKTVERATQDEEMFI